MITILFRTLIVYFALIVTMRLMGKRQIGELEVTDLVTTLLLSEIASLPITNHEMPVLYAIIPMVILLILEMGSSLILVHFPRLRNLVSAKPTVIIHKGKIRPRALDALRISIDELMSEIRQQGLTDLTQVETAILEKNGKLTVLPKAVYQPPTAKDLGLSPKSDSLMHIVWRNGAVSTMGLELIGKDRAWLLRKIQKEDMKTEELLCIMANEEGRLIRISKEEKTKK